MQLDPKSLQGDNLITGNPIPTGAENNFSGAMPDSIPGLMPENLLRTLININKTYYKMTKISKV